MSSLIKQVCSRVVANIGIHCHVIQGIQLSRRKIFCNQTAVPFMLLRRGMAGHSKWQNIRHTKEAKDTEKAKYSQRLTMRLRIAVQEGGSANPKFNSRLAAIMKEGKANNVPNATMENALKAIEKSTEGGKTLYVECMGPGNIPIIVEAFSDKTRHVRTTLQGVLKQYGGRVGVAGTAMHSFELKGMVVVTLADSSSANMDAATETAIECGAEDVRLTTSEDNQPVLQFICDSSDIELVKQNLLEMNHDVSNARLTYEPTIFTTVSSDTLNLVNDCFDAIEEHDFVIRIYDNIEVSS